MELYQKIDGYLLRRDRRKMTFTPKTEEAITKFAKEQSKIHLIKMN